jgi:hypothetical protein
MSYNFSRPIAPIIDPVTKDYVDQKGQISNGNSIETEIYARIVVPLGSLIYDPTFGSLLYSIGRNTYTNQQIKNLVLTSINPMIEGQRITVNDCEIKNLGYKINISLSVNDIMGDIIHLNIIYEH